VSVIASPGPIINADNPERISRRTATASDHAQERVLAHRQHQPFCEACRRTTAKRQTLEHLARDSTVNPHATMQLISARSLNAPRHAYRCEKLALSRHVEIR